MRKMLLLLSALFAFNASAKGLPLLVCSTNTEIDGWKGSETFEKLQFTAFVKSDTELQAALVTGAYISDTRDIKIVDNFKPATRKYQNYNKFNPTEDAWNWFYPLLPKDLADRVSPFRGYIRVMGEQGYKETYKLTCSIRR